MPKTVERTISSLQCAGDVLRALNISTYAPGDQNLLTLLDLAAASSDVAAFLTTVIEQPGVAIVANFDPPPDLVRRLSEHGIDWSKFFHLLPNLVLVCQAVDAYRPTPHHSAAGSHEPSTDAV